MSVDSQRYMVVTLAWLGCMVKIIKSVKSRNATFPLMTDDGQTHWQKKNKNKKKTKRYFKVFQTVNKAFKSAQHFQYIVFFFFFFFLRFRFPTCEVDTSIP